MKKILLMVVLVAIAQSAHCEIAGGDTAEWLSHSSAIIALATPMRVENIKGRGDTWRTKTRFRLDEVIKGSASSGDSITVYEFPSKNKDGQGLGDAAMGQKQLLLFARASDAKHPDVRGVFGKYVLAYKCLDEGSTVVNLYTPDFKVVTTRKELLERVRAQVEREARLRRNRYWTGTISRKRVKIPWGTEAHKQIYRGSSCFLNVPDYGEDTKEEQKLDIAVLCFSNRTLTVSRDGVDRQYQWAATTSSHDISTGEPLPEVPGLKIVSYDERHTKSEKVINISQLHLRTADGHEIILTHGEPVAVPRVQLLPPTNRVEALSRQIGPDDAKKAEECFRELQNERRRTNEGHRSKAAKKLAQLGEPAIPMLMGGLTSDVPYIAEWSRRALSDMGQPAIEHLRELAEGGPIETRISALAMLNQSDVKQDIRRTRIRPIFLAAADDPNPDVRKGGIRGLGHYHLGGDETAHVLVAALVADPSPIVRAQAALSLRQTGDAIAGPYLRGALQDTDAEVRAAVAGALGFRKDPGALEALVSLRRDDSPLVRWRAVASMRGLCEREDVGYFVPFLDDVEKSRHGAAGIEAAWIMGQLVGQDFGGAGPQRARKAQEWWDNEGQKLYGSNMPRYESFSYEVFRVPSDQRYMQVCQNGKEIMTLLPRSGDRNGGPSYWRRGTNSLILAADGTAELKQGDVSRTGKWERSVTNSWTGLLYVLPPASNRSDRIIDSDEE